MEEETFISNYMIKDHCDIEKHLNNLEKDIQENSDSTEESFKNFKWRLLRHFSEEEKVVFIQCDPSTCDQEIIDKISDEHKIMLEKLEEIEQEISRGNKPSVDELKRLIKEHSKFEDDELYPRLDEQLDESKKQIIIERLKKPLEE